MWKSRASIFAQRLPEMASNCQSWKLSTDVHFTLGLSMVSAFLPPHVALSRGAFQPFAALQSPCRQRRLLRSYPGRIPIALPRKSVFAKAPALSGGITPVSCWLAPYGASSVPCNGLRPVVPNGNTPHPTCGSRPIQWKPNPARRFTAAASCASAASPGSAFSRLVSATPRTDLAPTHPSTGRAAIKPRRAGYVKR